MKRIQLLLSALLFTRISGCSAQTLSAQVTPQSVPSATILSRADNYCHVKFPAIREETLGWDHPMLKDASSGDLIDFYGPCDHDPLGKEEVQLPKRLQYERRFDRR